MRVPRAERDRLTRSGRVFAFTLAGGFAFVALVGVWRDIDTLVRAASALSAVALLAGVLIPGRLEPARRAWMRFGDAIGRVTTPILMAIVFYGVVTPTGLVRRVFVRRSRSRETYWEPRALKRSKARMERQF